MGAREFDGPWRPHGPLGHPGQSGQCEHRILVATTELHEPGARDRQGMLGQRVAGARALTTRHDDRGGAPGVLRLSVDRRAIDVDDLTAPGQREHPCSTPWEPGMRATRDRE